MKPWTPDIDLSTVPDEVILSEAGRRQNARRKARGGGIGGGRPKVLKRCPNCRRKFGVAEMRKHRPECKPAAPATTA